MKKNKKIKIILNGRSRSLQKTTSVYDLMQSLKLSTNKDLYKHFTSQDTFSDRLVLLLLHFAFILKE